ncbi:MAG TPA: T9SS type A sorting domain-containing protein, partial [Bacteroidota bacterium]|nr:T9SS type A sorting domain-containing protein [Bacteroidota bacterium]
LTPGKGYWVKTNASGPITIGPVAAPKAAPLTFAGFSEIDITDAAGAKQKLYLSSDDRDLQVYGMPPVPPEGVFDMRFPGDRIAGRIGAGGAAELPVRMQGVAWPLTVSFSPGAAGAGEYSLIEYIGGKVAAAHILGADGKIVISGSDAHAISVRTTATHEAPSEFALAQNYPNPFNPTTRISFDVPVGTRVRLTVYNALGQQVKTLVDRDYVPGRYSVEADLSELPSGVYLYKLQAGSFSDAKKMMLVK